MKSIPTLSFTREGSQVQSLPRPHPISLANQGLCLNQHENRTERSNMNVTRTRTADVCGIGGKNPVLFFPFDIGLEEP